jgi:hypothetical protein
LIDEPARIIASTANDDTCRVIRLLPLFAALAPFLAIHVAYWLGIDTGRLPACVPYIDGCTSISSTGRHPPDSYVFKGVQLPFSVLLAWIWYTAYGWLIAIGARRNEWAIRLLPVAGTTGALALVVYVTFLGTSGDVYEFMRRFGIYFYFLGTWAAQLAVSLSLLRLSPRGVTGGMRVLAGWMLAVCAAPLVLGLMNIWLKATLEDADAAENRIEWLAALAMQAWYLLLYAAWKRTGIRLLVSVDKG